MSITLTVPDEIADSAAAVAARCGIQTERLLMDALRAHFPPIPSELRAEFDALERASDEDLLLLDVREGA